MTVLLTSDVHFTTAPRDSYRWGLFPWLKETIEKHKVTTLVINGDLTEAKDRHPSALVNSLVSWVAVLASMCDVVINKGNHDGLDLSQPFFGFLKDIPGVIFVTDPAEVDLPLGKALFLPNTPDPEAEWKDLRAGFNNYSAIFCHQTFQGCVRDNGTKSDEGAALSLFKGYRGKVYSGDIHVPQKLGPVTYIGAPYRIRFGDTFEPRCLLLEGSSEKNLHFPCLKKWVIDLTVEDFT